ncbi:hypothetical protein PUN28_018552 [Cardiocondyla obscurior]|uniref:Uncharacterized protein n=1 Tax=Cardiocondyla obscurior TaxID=286306 RepID=A0AAW2EEE2_9HYME
MISYFLTGRKRIFNTYIAILKSIYLEALRLFGSDHSAVSALNLDCTDSIKKGSTIRANVYKARWTIFFPRVNRILIERHRKYTEEIIERVFTKCVLILLHNTTLIAPRTRNCRGSFHEVASKPILSKSSPRSLSILPLADEALTAISSIVILIIRRLCSTSEPLRKKYVVASQKNVCLNLIFELFGQARPNIFLQINCKFVHIYIYIHTITHTYRLNLPNYFYAFTNAGQRQKSHFT